MSADDEVKWPDHAEWKRAGRAYLSHHTSLLIEAEYVRPLKVAHCDQKMWRNIGWETRCGADK